MKRVWKKMAALLMMMAMVLATGTTAGAVLLTTSGTVVTNTANVEITDVPSDTNMSYATYQVIYATYDTDSNSFAWHLTDWAETALTNASWNGTSTALCTSADDALAAVLALTNQTGSTGNVTTEQNDIVNTLAAYIDYAADGGSAVGHAYADGTSIPEWTTTSGNTPTETSSATLEVGAYLVIPTATDYSFLNMLVSVDVDGTTGTNGSTAKDGWVLTSNGAVLKGSPLSITKTVCDTETGTYGSTADAQIGTKVYYQVTVSVPKFAKNDSEKVFKVEDTATNLKIDATSVKVYAYGSGTELVAYDATTAANSTAQYYASTDTTGSKLTVIFSDADYPFYDRTFYDDANKTYPYEYVIISYSAELLDEAVVTTGNENSATLTYDYDNHISVTTEAAKTTVYTYEVDLTKLADGTSAKLSNASFEIKDSSGNTLYFIKDDSASTAELPVYRVADTSVATKSSVITTGTDGVRIIGLDESVAYTISETVAPSGYSLNTNTLTFTITDTAPDGKIDSISVTETQGNNNITWSTADPSTPSGNTWTVGLVSDSGAFSVSVTDTKISALPATGSVGIIVFTIAGVIIMILALVLINSGKSKAKKA